MTSVITKCDRYYKLQSATVYYKVRKNIELLVLSIPAVKMSSDYRTALPLKISLEHDAFNCKSAGLGIFCKDKKGNMLTTSEWPNKPLNCNSLCGSVWKNSAISLRSRSPNPMQARNEYRSIFPAREALG